MNVRQRTLATLRRLRPFGPAAIRVAVFLALMAAAGAPSAWSTGLGATPAQGAPASHADAARDAMSAVYQVPPTGGDATPTATAVTAPGAPPPPPPPPAAPAAPAAPGVPPPPAQGVASPSPMASPPTPTPYIGDPCWGDEQMAFTPADPRANNELLITVTSSKPHPYGRLTGTEKPTFVRERQGQLGYVWEWTVPLTWPGKHHYTFNVDSTIPCKTAEITVRRALATATPDTDTSNDNGTSNNNDD